VIKALQANQGILFDVPAHMEETVAKLKRIQDQLTKESGRTPSPAEVATEACLPIERVESVLRFSQKVETDGRPHDFENIVSAFLLDTPSSEHGGTGRTFDWSLAVEFKKQTKKPVILSGGLNPENVAEAIRVVQPYAVDVSSGVESSPGRKDHAKLRDFIRQCKS
jgi:phosphoribosylanthranilate isomerase